MRRRRRTEDQAEINVTPLLDVVFILLIFFIVTTTFVREIGVALDRPAAAPVEERELSDMIALRIDATGRIYVNDRLVDIRAVQANVASALAADVQAPVVVIAERNADAGVLVRVIDQARMAGAERVSVATPTR